MKINNIIKFTSSMAVLAVAMLMTSCTSEFDKWNTDPNSATEEQMTYDGNNTGGFFAQMEHNAKIVGLDKGGAFQITDMLTGGLFSGYFSNIKESYDVGAIHNAHYSLPDKWVNQPFNDTYNNVMTPWRSLKINAEKDQTPSIISLANIVKVYAMHRISDMYGPIIYSHFGDGIQNAYDDQESVYKTFFNELDEAIDNLTAYYEADNNATLLAKFDYVFGGNVSKWIKFANTLRLRLALRIVYANESLARTEAQKSFDHALGFLEESAIHSNDANYSYLNPFWEVTISWSDMRMGACIESYLNGYSDPRAKIYFNEASDGGGIHGVYPGLQIRNQSSYTGKTSSMNVESGSPMQWMSAAESFFLRAEANLRWGMGSDAKTYYEDGVRASLQERGVGSNADAYLSSTATPADFEDNSGNRRNATAVSTITVAWDDYADFETNLERIITQKYLAIFPDGQEAWSEYRRTGYPKLFPIDYNGSGGTVDSNLGIRRLRFPADEYSTNGANVNTAVGMLNGADNGGTKLWWDKNPRH